MPSQFLKQFSLLFLFYRSTLQVSIPVAVVACPFFWPHFMLGFGLGLMSVGMIFSLLYREISFQHEYYFYYNLGVPKSRLIISSILINVIIGSILIGLSK